jgi:hypothetical protein
LVTKHRFRPFARLFLQKNQPESACKGFLGIEKNIPKAALINRELIFLTLLIRHSSQGAIRRDLVHRGDLAGFQENKSNAKNKRIPTPARLANLRAALVSRHALVGGCAHEFFGLGVFRSVAADGAAGKQLRQLLPENPACFRRGGLRRCFLLSLFQRASLVVRSRFPTFVKLPRMDRALVVSKKIRLAAGNPGIATALHRCRLATEPAAA